MCSKWLEDAKSGNFESVATPHVGHDAFVAVRAAGSNILRQGVKMDRTVLLPAPRRGLQAFRSHFLKDLKGFEAFLEALRDLRGLCLLFKALSSWFRASSGDGSSLVPIAEELKKKLGGVAHFGGLLYA